MGRKMEQIGDTSGSVDGFPTG